MIDHFLFPKYWNTINILKPEKSMPEEVHAAKTVPNVFDKDELALAHAKKLGGAEWPVWLEAVKKELTSLIIENEVFVVIEYEDVPIEKRNKIYNLSVLLQCKRDQHQEMNKYKARFINQSSIWQSLGDVALGYFSNIHKYKCRGRYICQIS
jgi:hypothetical protein